jgi:iron-sulfur cluster assembly accessory protein
MTTNQPHPTIVQESFAVTDRAARRIAEILKGEPAARLMRVSVEGGGCSGFQYRFDLVADQAADDIAIDHAGVRVVIDPVSLPLIAGSKLDFVDDLIGAQFKIRNPQAKMSCGCGTSFSL